MTPNQPTEAGLLDERHRRRLRPPSIAPWLLPPARFAGVGRSEPQSGGGRMTTTAHIDMWDHASVSRRTQRRVLLNSFRSRAVTRRANGATATLSVG